MVVGNGCKNISGTSHFSPSAALRALKAHLQTERFISGNDDHN